MKINYNMSAVIANSQLLRNENSLSSSVERLSSGLKINHASDDAAGMAMSTKLKAQIKGLDQASRNSSDGVSVLETADGALQEVVSMLQRMRELSVQASNDTNTMEDKQAIQSEISSLTEEVDRISKDTEFNTKKLLDGSVDQRVYTNIRSISRIGISDTVSSGQYDIKITQDARQAVLVGDGQVQNGQIPEGTVIINGVKVEIKQGQNLQEVFDNLRKGAEEGEVNVFATKPPLDNTVGDSVNAGYKTEAFAAGTNLVFVSDSYGSAAEMNIKCDNPALANFLGIKEEASVKGTDAMISLENGFTSQASYLCDGNTITISDRNGFELKFETETGTAKTVFTDVTATEAAGGGVFGADVGASVAADVAFDVTSMGTMTLQIGANENQVMNVRIPSTSAKNLYIDKVNVCTINGADSAITTYDKAIGKVSDSRSRIGAYQNRLEHSVSSLEATELNMTSALSRIEDVDMAEEMSTYTQFNILSQAATSVLAQANDIPQQALQLLQ